MRRRCSPGLGGGLSCVGAAWCCLDQARENARGLQTCSEAGKVIGASSWRSEATGEFLEVVRTWDNDRRGVL